MIPGPLLQALAAETILQGRALRLTAPPATLIALGLLGLLMILSWSRVPAGRRVAGLAFAVAPQLGAIETPNGRVELLTAVGVTADELERMQSTSSAAVLAELGRITPLLVTDPART